MKPAKCPVCRSSETQPLLLLERVPVQDGRIWSDQHEAVHCPVGTIDLRLCLTCTHAWNECFDFGLLKFDADYDISLHCSPIYQSFTESVMDRLIERFTLHGKTVFELGCGKGEFLTGVCQRGGNRGIGFDPTYVPPAEALADVTVHRRMFSKAEAGLVQADFALSRSVLQYSRDPNTFVELLVAVLAENRKTGVYLEVPNGRSTFGDKIVWNLAYEHGNLYSNHSIARLLLQQGFEELNVLDCFKGQNLSIEATRHAKTLPPAAIDPETHLAQDKADYIQSVRSFAGSLESTIQSCRDRLSAWQKQGKRLAVWGAGARAVGLFTLLNLKATDWPIAVVDINPKRQGRFMPVSGHEVTSPMSLPAFKPDIVLATNPTFAAEIREQFNQLSIPAKFEVL